MRLGQSVWGKPGDEARSVSQSGGSLGMRLGQSVWGKPGDEARSVSLGEAWG